RLSPCCVRRIGCATLLLTRNRRRFLLFGNRIETSNIERKGLGLYSSLHEVFCRLPFPTIGYGIPTCTCFKWLIRSIRCVRAWRPVPISSSTSPPTPNLRLG